MRVAVRQRLIDAGTAAQGRVFEPHAVTAATPKPFLVVREAPETAEEPWSSLSTPLEVWPFVAQTTFQALDALVDQVVAALRDVRVSDASGEWLVTYEGGAAEDQRTSEWDAITRPQRFRAYHLGWLGGLTFDPDPVAAMRAWTEVAVPGVQTNPATWDPQDGTPGVYWRLVELRPGEQSAGVRWLVARLRGHVVAPSAAVRLTTGRRVVEALWQTPGQRAAMSDGGPLLFDVDGTVLDVDAHPLRTGQVLVQARFGVLEPAGAAEVLRQAHLIGDVQEVVTG